MKLFQNKYFIIGLAVLVLVGIAVFIFSQKKGEIEKTGKVSSLPKGIEYFVVSKEKRQYTIELPGTVVPKEKAALSSKVAGRVVKNYKDQGDSVRSGELVAEIEKVQIELQLLQAKKRVASARANYRLSQSKYRNAKMGVEKQIISLDQENASLLSKKAEYEKYRITKDKKEQLFQIGGISETEYNEFLSQYESIKAGYYSALKEKDKNEIGFRMKDLSLYNIKEPKTEDEWLKAVIKLNTDIEYNELQSALESVRSAEADVKLSEIMLRETRIVSPISGVIASRTYDIGEMVKENEAMFTVVKTTPVYISTSVNEEKLIEINKKDKVLIEIDAAPGKVFQGKVDIISPVVDPKTRTGEIKVIVDNSDDIIKTGMFARMNVIIREKEVITVPDSALRDAESEDSKGKEKQIDRKELFVIKDGKAFKKSVLVGSLYDDGREINEGLDTGEFVIISNTDSLESGEVLFSPEEWSIIENEKKSEKP